MTTETETENVRLTKPVIASKAAFTYEEARMRKDDPYVPFHSFIHCSSPHSVLKARSLPLIIFSPRCQLAL